jgi:ATP-dependent protease ClpP protease subunit
MRTLILALALLVASTASALTVKLSEEVDGSWPAAVFTSSIAALFDGDKYVDLQIDSPGGSVDAALMTKRIMESGRASGLTYRCFIDGKAMSAAFFIMTVCDERYATRKSTFLIHEMWTIINPSDIYPTTDPELYKAMGEAMEVQKFMNEYQAERMRVSWSVVQPYYEEESVFDVYTLVRLAPGFISVGVH